MIDDVTNFQSTEGSGYGGKSPVKLFAEPDFRHNMRSGDGFSWGVALAALTVLLLLGIGIGWVGISQFHKEKSSLRLMRESIEGSLAPGEMVIVDDRLLGWALQRGSDRVLRESVWTISEDTSVDSLLARVVQAKRPEVVVVASPEDRLIRSLDAAGFSVAQEVGWVPWDPSGNGRALLGRGKMRIYFVVVPKQAGATMPAGAVSSGAMSR